MTLKISSSIRDNQWRGKVGDFLKDKIHTGSKLSIVSAYFTIYAYEQLKEKLHSIDHLNFLFGEPRFVTQTEQVKGADDFELITWLVINGK